LLARDRKQARETIGFCSREASAQRRQAVVLPPFIDVFTPEGPAPRIRFAGTPSPRFALARQTPASFSDPAVFKHSMERPVKRPGLDREIAVGQIGDLLQDAVAVPLLGGESQQNVELNWS
jgi:hypothetical protein